MDKLKKFNFNENILNPLNENVLKPIKAGDLRAILLYVAIPALIFAIIVAISITLIVRKKNASIDRRLRVNPKAVIEKDGRYFEFSFGSNNKYSVYKVVKDGEESYIMSGYDFYGSSEEKELLNFEKNNDNSYSFEININNNNLSFECRANQTDFYLIQEIDSDERSSNAGTEERITLQSFAKIKDILREDKKAEQSQEKFVLDMAQILVGQRQVDPKIATINAKIKNKQELTDKEKRILKQNISIPILHEDGVSNDNKVTKDLLQKHHDKVVSEFNTFKTNLQTQIQGQQPTEKLETAKNNFMQFANLQDLSDGKTIKTRKTGKTNKAHRGLNSVSNLPQGFPGFGNDNPRVNAWLNEPNSFDPNDYESFDESESNQGSLLIDLKYTMNNNFTTYANVDGIQIYRTNTDNRYFINFNGQDKELAGFEEKSGFYQFGIDGIWYLYNINDQKFQKAENGAWVDFSNEDMKSLIYGQVNNSININAARRVFADARSA